MSKYYIIILSLLSIPQCTHLVSVPHPNDLYNQALEHYTRKSIGQAMVDAKTAFLLMPTNMKIRKLVYTLRKEIGLPSILYKDNNYNLILTTILYTIPPNLAAMIATIFLILVSIWIASQLLLTNIPRYINYFGVFCVLNVCIFTILCLNYSYQIFWRHEAIVINNSDIFEEPSEYSHSTYSVQEGLEVSIIEKSHDYFLIKSIVGEEGWIPSNCIQPLLK